MPYAEFPRRLTMDPSNDTSTPSSNDEAITNQEPAVELLVEEVSIDGLCGVY
jgi:mycofactocin precursor